MTREQTYREQMKALGIYEEIFEPEIKTLAQLERELTRAQKAWSATASPKGSRPSFLNEHYAVIQKLRAEILQHRDALGLTPKGLKKLTGAAGTDAPIQKDLITEKLDRIAERVAGYDNAETDPRWWMQDQGGGSTSGGKNPDFDPYEKLRKDTKVQEISDKMDAEDHADLKAAVAEDMG